MKIYYTEHAKGDLQKLPRDMQKRIATKMRFYASQRDPLQFAKRLTNHNEGDFRFRIGDYRIFLDVDKDTLYILRIVNRSDAY